MANHDRAQLIALDWGTSSCRAFLLGDDGVVLAERRQPHGVMAVTAAAAESGMEQGRAFDESFERLCGDWLGLRPTLPVIACGMVGSNHGWAEAGYRPVPVDLAADGVVLTAAAMRRGTAVHIIPGLISDSALPGVMRGEETQILGALSLRADTLDRADRVALLPGTHSKWVRISGTTVTAFTTCMTGELFALLRTDSTLSRLSTPPPHPDWEAFGRGLDVSAQPTKNGGILNTAFSARALVITGRLAPDEVDDYLSGLLIGDEVAGIARSWLGDETQEILLCGETGLNDRYRRALERFGLAVTVEVARSAPAGMWQVAVAAGLMSGAHRSAVPPTTNHDASKSKPEGQSVHTSSETTVQPGLIAILRGLTTAEANDVGHCLYDAGFRSLEVPLNSPDPLRTIAALRDTLPADCVVGAGTVLTVDEVRQCHAAGAQIIVSPNTNPAVIAETVRLGMASFPGAATPSDAFAAIEAGAENVKIFPAEQVGRGGLKAWTAVLPSRIALLPVGGVDASNLGAWVAAGATGFGIGSSLYAPGIGVEDLRRRADALIVAWKMSTTSTRKSE